MPSRKPILTIRTTQELIDRLQKISESQNRSMSNMGETIIKNYLDEYEAKNQRLEQKGKLSESKIG